MSTTNWNRDPKNSVGKPRRRVDGRARSPGQAASPTTCRCRACCTAASLRSPCTHAKILGIDASKALARARA
jgi:CO/xanthine dehydrogenase Mo-binding subunit